MCAQNILGIFVLLYTRSSKVKTFNGPINIPIMRRRRNTGSDDDKFQINNTNSNNNKGETNRLGNNNTNVEKLRKNDTAIDDDHENMSNTTKSSHNMLQKNDIALRMQTIILFSCYILSTLTLCVGIYHRIIETKTLKINEIEETVSFHNGKSCCNMTYSHYQFLPIQLRPSNQKLQRNRKPNENYRLLKFIDARDIRYKTILSKKKFNPKNNEIYPSSTINELCSFHSNNKSKIVFYIPGHGGNYDQGRSIGAHGIQLTNTRYTRNYMNKLYNQMLYDKNFVTLEVYSFDFVGDNGSIVSSGSSGYIMQKQLKFVIFTIESVLVRLYTWFVVFF